MNATLKTVKISILTLCLFAAFNTQASTVQNSCKTPQLNNCPSPVDKKLPNVKNMLTWNQQQRAIGFRNDYRSYTGDVFHAAGGKPLPHATQNLNRVSYQLYGQIM